MSYYDYGTTSSSALGAMSSLQSSLIWVIVSIVVALIGGVAVYFTFLSKKNSGKFKGFLGWLYDFLTFKIFVVDTLYKIIYTICAIAITLLSFVFIKSSFLTFILVLIFGNIALRITFELGLILFELFENVKEINSKLKK